MTETKCVHQADRATMCDEAKNRPQFGVTYKFSNKDVTCTACLAKMDENINTLAGGTCTDACPSTCRANHKPTEPPAVKVGQVWQVYSSYLRQVVSATVEEWSPSASAWQLGHNGVCLFKTSENLQREGRLVRDAEEDTTVDEYINSRNAAQIEPMISRAEHKLLLKEAEGRGYQRGWREGIAAEKSAFQRGWQKAMDDVKDNVDRFKMNLYQDFSETEQATRAKPSEPEPKLLPSNAHDDDFCGDA